MFMHYGLIVLARELKKSKVIEFTVTVRRTDVHWSNRTILYCTVPRWIRQGKKKKKKKEGASESISD